MRKFTHLTPRYILDRLALIAYERSYPDAPWLTKATIDILSSWLRPHDQGLEWGSGRSTVWFAQRVNGLISIEHNAAWYHKVRCVLEKRNVKNVDYRLSTGVEAEYLAVIQQINSESLDFALVDGIARDKCALAAVTLIKPGGILIIDNFNLYIPSPSRAPCSRQPHEGPASETWRMFLEEVKAWRGIWTTNGVWDTWISVKPSMQI